MLHTCENSQECEICQGTYTEKIFKVKDRFNSFQEFSSKLKDYEKAVLSNYWIRDSRTLKIQSRRFPNGSAAKAKNELKYYYCRVSCIKGGRGYNSKNVQGQTLTFRQGCQAGMFLKLSYCGMYLELLELNEEHNHTVSSELFQTLPHQCVKSPKRAKSSTPKVSQLKGIKKLIKNKIVQKTGSLVMLKGSSSNLNWKLEEKEFSKGIDLLREGYNCNVDILCNEQKTILGVFFQDSEMKKMFRAYPEVMIVDGTNSLRNGKATVYLIMIEDSEGNGAIVAVGILLDENEESLSWFIENFKNTNSYTNKIKIIMTDKDSKERSVLKENFPHAALQIYLLYALQIFNKEVSQKNMNLSKDQCKVAKQFFTKLVYANSENVYEKEYENMKASVPRIAINYFENNWHPIKDQWVMYLTLNNKSFSREKKKVENVNQKLKSVILNFSSFEDFIHNFFVCINSMRVNRNKSNSMYYHKVSTGTLPYNSEEDAYKELLTNYAFQKVQQQMYMLEDCTDFEINQEGKYFISTSKGMIEVTNNSCGCMFSKSMGLPCLHILKFRHMNNMCLFDENLCLSRWTRKYHESRYPVFNPPESASCDNTVMRTGSVLPKHKILTSRQKHQLMKNECSKLIATCSRVSSDIFHKRLEFIKQLTEEWSRVEDAEEEVIECEVEVHEHQQWEFDSPLKEPLRSEQCVKRIKWS